MKTCLNALNGITNEISSKVYKDYGWNPIDVRMFFIYDSGDKRDLINKIKGYN